MTNEQTIDEIMLAVDDIEDKGILCHDGEGPEPIAERSALRIMITAALAAKDAEIAALKAQLAGTAKPAPGEWIEWAGGECPIADGVQHEIRMRDGWESSRGADAQMWSGWVHDDSAYDIVAYRVLP